MSLLDDVDNLLLNNNSLSLLFFDRLDTSSHLSHSALFICFITVIGHFHQVQRPANTAKPLLSFEHYFNIHNNS